MDNIYFKAVGLCAGYTGNTVAHDISFHIPRGSILTLIGPNGAGKSTILKAITRQLKAASGTVYLDGKELRSITAKDLAKQMSVMLTDRVSPELMTAREVVAMGRYPYTGRFGRLTQEDEAVIEESLQKTDAIAFADKRFDEMSDGQRQRIMLARALCQKPEVLVLDEPTSFLDIRYKLDILGILLKMARTEKLTILMSLHEIDLAYQISDSILCVKDGETVLFGTPEEVFQDDVLEELFGIDKGIYNHITGRVELPLKTGCNPKVLAVGGGGSGIRVYRQLSRNALPFYAGILFANDIECPTALALAEEAVITKAFCEVEESKWQRAVELLTQVDTVIDCGCVHGSYDNFNTKLLQKAAAMGKAVVVYGSEKYTEIMHSGGI